MNAKGHHLNAAQHTDWVELASAFGAASAWQATIKQLITREAKTSDPRKKMHLRLMLLNAQTQLELTQ
tara:strand:- start:104 stop:307 length:204 start_codon:yes stop_codon:yes gene_type:complete